MGPMTTASALSILRDLRPQAYGTTSPGRIANPLLEPEWAGVRVLVGVDGETSEIVDENGEPVTDQAMIEANVRASLAADAAIIDGFLTKQVSHDGTGVYTGTDQLPSTGKLITQSMIGNRRDRRAEAIEHMEREREARTFGPSDRVSLVAIDLLLLDGESLLDIPLLERKRLLESVLTESDLVRRGIYVRPPIDTWVNSWRALGFTGLCYKAANGRYHPGGAKDDWAIAPMPRR